MRYREITEAPIGTIANHGEFDGNGTFRNNDDIRAIHSNKAMAKVRRIFENTPWTFDLHFYDRHNIHYDPNDVVNYLDFHGGVYEIEQLKPIKGLDITLSAPDAIAVVITNNDGRNRVPLTPWIIAHRIGHGLAADESSPYATTIQNIWIDIKEPMTSLRDGWEIWGLGALYVLGTMRSARMRNLNAAVEMPFECLAQFLVQGRVRFNRLENVSTFPTHTGGEQTVEFGRHLDDINDLIASAEYQVNAKLKRLFDDLRGKAVCI